MSIYQKRRTNVRGIIIHEGKLFAVRHRWADGTPASAWCVPGGGLDPGEGLIDGVRRETIEEPGITPVVGRLLYIQQLRSTRDGYDEELEFFFHIQNTHDYMAEICLDTTTHGCSELAECGFIDPATHNILPEFLCHRDIAAYLNSGEVATYNYLGVSAQ